MTEEQTCVLEGLGRERHVSKAELIRQAVDLFLSREALKRGSEEQRRRALEVAERFRSSRSGTAPDHDEALAEALAPLLRMLWVDEDTYQQSVSAVLTAERRKLSLVDCTSFVLMRRYGFDAAFAFDNHFPEQGFKTIP